jgi:chromosome segregation protein
VAALVGVEAGYEAAVAAALGPAADAIAVADADAAIAAIGLLKADDAGRAGLLLASGGTPGPGADPGPGGPLPGGARGANDVVRTARPLAPAVAAALRSVAIAADLPSARALVESGAASRAATLDGDLVEPGWASGGSAAAPSTLEIQSAVDEAQRHVEDAVAAATSLGQRIEQARADAGRAAAAEAEALDALHASDASLAAVAEQLARLGQVSRTAAAEADRLESAGRAAREERERDLGGLAELEERLAAAQADPVEQEPSTEQRDEHQRALGAARQREMDARLAVRTGEERVRAMSGRADALLRAARAEREARAREQAAAAERAAGAAIAADVAAGAGAALERIGESLARAQLARDSAAEARAMHEGELLAVRAGARELAGQLERLTDAAHRDEVARTEQRLRIEALQARAIEEFGLEPDALAADYHPGAPVPPSAAEMAEYELARERGEAVIAPQPRPYDRAEQEKRAARGERELALLGKVNPLALEEFAALEERHQFLSAQLEDLRNSRRDLLTVVREVDERILEVFASAYRDVAREFEVVFAALFPGGEGRLALTDPDDMLTTGIEVEARPPGKKVRRLSLLSGGERSLTAVALLVAIFRARPSPFYVMDEVEAALDDVNLGRLIGLIGELRDTSQLIVITHQKRTMEIADALYGVSMRADGITRVISQRLRAET